MTITINGFGPPPPVKPTAFERVLFPVLALFVVPVALAVMIAIEFWKGLRR